VVWVAVKARREEAVRAGSSSMGVCPRPGSISTIAPGTVVTNRHNVIAPVGPGFSIPSIVSAQYHGVALTEDLPAQEGSARRPHPSLSACWRQKMARIPNRPVKFTCSLIPVNPITRVRERASSIFGTIRRNHGPGYWRDRAALVVFPIVRYQGSQDPAGLVNPSPA
jgi:hypothetical protein